jgi:acyl-CoA thioester hydrolase
VDHPEADPLTLEIDDPLAGFADSVEIPVQWGDQDAFRHVNNTVYVRWFESSRISYSRKVGLWELIEAENIGPILASIHCDYRRPLTYPDTVKVGSRIVKVGRTSLTMEHRVVALSSGLVAAEGMAVLVLYDYNKAEPCPIPDPIRRAIEALEGARAEP